jgi:TonB family protein
LNKYSRPSAFLVIAFLVATLSSSRAGDQSADAAALLANARKLEDLQSEPLAPFVVKAQLSAAFAKGTVEGEYALTWWDRKRWNELLTLADFRRAREGVTGGYTQVRSLDYQREVIFDIDEVLDVSSLLRLSQKESLKTIHKRNVAGLELACVPVYVKDYQNRELCFDPSSGLLVHAEVKAYGTPEDARHSIDYAAFKSIGDRRFPSKMSVSCHDGYSIDISDTQLDALGAPPAAATVADPRSELWQDCRDATPSEIAQQTPPRYPQESKERHEQGVVTVYARIETDGSVSHLKALQIPYPALAQATIDAVGRWKYKPRTCGGTPVREEKIIQVSYALGG